MNWLHTALLLLAGTLFGIQLLFRLVRECRWGVLLSLGPLQGLALLELAANFTPYAYWPRLPYIFLAAALLMLAVPAPGLEEFAPLSRRCKIVLGLTMAIVVIYTQYAQMRYLDTDNWVHEPLIAFYMRGVWPPITPYFPDIPLHGHYGRDLLMAVLTLPPADPLSTVWAVNMMISAGSFAGIFFVGLRCGVRAFPAYLAALLIFFGICCGSRVGMADTFDGNNGIVYGMLVLLFYHLARVLEFTEPVAKDRWTPARCLLAGMTLGGYQAIYETTFGVLFLVGLTLILWLRRGLRTWIGLLAVAAVAFALACTEGGPLTDMAQRKHGTNAEIVTQTEQNQGQHVSMHFPKEKLFQVLVTTADYQRVSAAFGTKLFAKYKPALAGEGYMYVFDPRFLYAHWLPLYLAPLSGWWLWRRRSALGATFWLFGFWAYLVPAIVDFGPLYELEYFRWEYAASWGFAGALGLTLGEVLLESSGEWPKTTRNPFTLTFPRRFPILLIALLVLGASLATGEKLLNDGLIDAQRSRLKLIQTPSSWRIHQKDLGIGSADIQAMEWLAPQVKAYQRVLSDLGSETPVGIWPDAVLAARIGAPAMGHDRPPEGSRQHAHPNYYRNALERAFVATGRIDLVEASNIQWVFLDPSKMSAQAQEILRKSLPDLKTFESEGEARWVAAVPSPVPSVSVGEPTVEVHLVADPEELRAGQRYPLEVRLRNLRSEKIHVGWLRSQVEGEPPLDLRIDQDLEPGADLRLEHSLVTPLGEGEKVCRLSLTDPAKVLIELPFRVDLKKRLVGMRARLDLPDAFERKRFYSLRLGLTSQNALKAGHEFTVAWRLHSPGGDYLWDLDAIPQELELNLEANQEKIFFVQFLSPSEPGLYAPEIVLREKSTGETLPLSGEFAPIRVP